MSVKTLAKSFTSEVAGATILLVFLSLIGKGIGFFREVLVAGFFGAGTEYELYLVGAVFPITLNTILYFISQNYFIPKYHELKSGAENSHTRFTSGMFWTFFLGTFFFSAVLFLFSEQIMSYYAGEASPETGGLAVNIFRMLLLTVPMNAGFSVLAGYLNAENKYSLPAVSQLFTGIIQIISILLLYNLTGIYSLPAGLVAGFIIQLAYLYFHSGKVISLKFNKGLIAHFGRTGLSSFILYISFIEIINQLYVIADRYYYNRTEAGGIAALNYANNVYLLPIGIVSAGLVTVLFPKISEAFNMKNFDRLKYYYKKSIIVNALVYLPVITVLLIWGDYIIILLFERGKFTPYNTFQTFRILQIFLISLLFYSSYAIIHKMILGMNLVKQLFYIAAACFVVKVILNEILITDFQQYGLAAATTASYILMAVSGYFVVSRKLRTL